MFGFQGDVVAGVLAALLAFWAAPAAAQGPVAPDKCRWTSAAGETAGQQELSCAGPDGGWIPAARPFDIDVHTVTDARAGVADAMVELGLFYLGGPDEARDVQSGLDWLRRAADKGSVSALRYLGLAYRDGYAAPRDYAEAVRWFSVAADRGDARSMALLATLYSSGEGLRQDYAQAAHWFRAAADKGDVNGMVGLANLYYRGVGVAKNDQEALLWVHKAADKGDYHAMRMLAFMSSDGLGGPKDAAEAKRWNDAAAVVLRWERGPSSDELQLAYPTDAAAAGIGGRVRYQSELAEDRSVHHCHLLGEDPPNFGFGRAGRSIVGKFRLGPGLPAGSEIVVPIRFALPWGGKTESRATADVCAAYATVLLRAQRLSGVTNWWGRYWIALSRRYALANGGVDTPERLAPQVSEAAQRLTDGKDRGFLGRVSLCHLRS